MDLNIFFLFLFIEHEQFFVDPVLPRLSYKQRYDTFSNSLGVSEESCHAMWVGFVFSRAAYTVAPILTYRQPMMTLKQSQGKTQQRFRWWNRWWQQLQYKFRWWRWETQVRGWPRYGTVTGGGDSVTALDLAGQVPKATVQIIKKYKKYKNK